MLKIIQVGEQNFDILLGENRVLAIRGNNVRLEMFEAKQVLKDIEHIYQVLKSANVSYIPCPTCGGVTRVEYEDSTGIRVSCPVCDKE